VSDPLEAIKVLLAAVAAGLALYTFWRNLKVRRAEWLASLYERFYLNDGFKRTRALLDYESEERTKLLGCLEADPENAGALEPLVDYLNFFEFVASLWKLGQLKTEEVEMMFEYYIRDLAKKPEVMGFIRKEGFEKLQELIAKINPP
jgi:hypothetical protein